VSTLYLDSATSDRWKFPIKKGVPAPDETQPFLVRLAWELDDADGETIKDAGHLIRMPEGHRMAGETAHFLGIYDHHILQSGRSLEAVMEEFSAALAEASVVVAHFWQFHKHALDKSFRDLGQHTPVWPSPRCAMIAATNIVQIRMEERNQFKSPSFDQCCEHFCGGKLQLTSNPVADGIARVRAVRLFWHNILAV
jgi:hypothetical protein